MVGASGALLLPGVRGRRMTPDLREVTDAEWDAAKQMRAAGKKWRAISRALDIGVERLRRALDPDYAEKRNRSWMKRRATIKERDAADPIGGAAVYCGGLTPEEVERALASVPFDTRNLTQRICGDPLPGRSALDHRVHA